jgi:serine protease Do
MKSWKKLIAVGFALALAGTACGGGDDDDSSSDTTEASSNDGDDAKGAITSMEDAESAVIRIVSKGTFAEPSEEGVASYNEVTGVGSGSGFIIDPEGIAVTNNHVVTGAASLEVYVGGNEDDPVNAKVLGVSECDDLAVIDLEGDGYPFLKWSDDPPKTGREVRAAGFPLGDPEFTLTSGIISKAEANGDTPWASTPNIIEHDAAIQPGNSGGPLLDAETAEVVGVDYATNDPGTGTNQFFAIGAELAEDVVDQMAEGENVLALGVNGQAIFQEEDGVVGVWVSSVESGSPASDVGLQGGDIIERIEGLPLATDGTMKDYCDILRSHDPTDTLSVQVLRFADATRYRGEFNGEELAPSESLAATVEEETGAPLAEAAAYDYVPVTDDSGRLYVEIPSAWAELETAPYVDPETGDEYPGIVASSSLDGLANSYDVAGMAFVLDPTGLVTVEDLLTTFEYSADCVTDGPQAYDDTLYVGQSQFWKECGPNGTGWVAVIAAQPEGGEFTALVQVQGITEADADALGHIIDTFRVITE